MPPTLKVTIRNGKYAAWIGGRNVWDIDPEQWTEDVQAAILSAYRIGHDYARDEMIAACRSLSTEMPTLMTWPPAGD